jgi:hypothetical protein
MNNSPDNALLARAIRELESTRARVRDLEGFIRIYPELIGTAFEMPSLETAPVDTPVEQTTAAPTLRPEISLADPGLSISEAAEKVLRHHAREMKAREIAEALLAWDYPYQGTIQELRASVGGVLARKVREGEIFTKPESGLFGLAEWGTRNVPISRVPQQPVERGLFSVDTPSWTDDGREVA